MRNLFLILVWFFTLSLMGQVQRIYDPEVRTLTVHVDGNPTAPPLLEQGKQHNIEIAWDQMSHDYIRYIYHIQHCDRDWNPSEEIFERDYLAGLNDQLIEDYEKSFNTTQLYTHYRLVLPNRDTRLLLSGNYRVRIFHEGDDVEEDTPVLEAQFCVYERAVNLRATVSSNTDIDFNKSHQQISLSIGYGTLNVVDPQRELKTVVMQNRRWDNRVEGLVPNVRSHAGIEFTHNRQLIFPATNEFHRFEILDVHRTALGVDKMEWFEPYFHATLFPDQCPGNYSYLEDQNGVSVIRSADDMDDATTAEYVFVHFLLQSPRLPGGDVYVCGQWSREPFHPDYRMEYDEVNRQYHLALLLKQGYYSYQYLQENGSTARTMGDFYETENEYAVLVYYRGQSARYDRLAGYTVVHANKR